MRSFWSGSVASTLPEWVQKILLPLKDLRNVVRAVPYYGKGRFCPVCGKSSRRFRNFRKRQDVICPHCGAFGRHRLLWLFLQKKTNFFDGQPKKMLHVAPESCFESRFKELLGGDYLTADLFSPRAMVKMDITDIQYTDSSFDIIYCSHVLEHVIDDKQAMREFLRVLKDDGWAILLVPITREKTFEDSSIVDPKERKKAFGMEDHVRRYGSDYVERLRDAGFTVNITTVRDLADTNDSVKMGLPLAGSAGGDIYYCTK